MLGRLLSRFTRTRGEDSEDGEFLRSRLDASVLSAHGMGTEKADSEMADIEERGRELEDVQRER